MAKKTTTPTLTLEPLDGLDRGEQWQLFATLLLAIFRHFNGHLWRVRTTARLRAGVNVLVNSIALFGFERTPE